MLTKSQSQTPHQPHQPQQLIMPDTQTLPTCNDGGKKVGKKGRRKSEKSGAAKRAKRDNRRSTRAERRRAANEDIPF